MRGHGPLHIWGVGCPHICNWFLRFVTGFLRGHLLLRLSASLVARFGARGSRLHAAAVGPPHALVGFGAPHTWVRRRVLTISFGIYGRAAPLRQRSTFPKRPEAVDGEKHDGYKQRTMKTVEFHYTIMQYFIGCLTWGTPRALNSTHVHYILPHM